MIPWERRLGDFGESEIKGRLQRFSSVTKIETDVGIDFYCELIINDIPTTPFYVQAKSTDQIFQFRFLTLPPDGAKHCHRVLRVVVPHQDEGCMPETPGNKRLAATAPNTINGAISQATKNHLFTLNEINSFFTIASL